MCGWVRKLPRYTSFDGATRCADKSACEICVIFSFATWLGLATNLVQWKTHVWSNSDRTQRQDCTIARMSDMVEAYQLLLGNLFFHLSLSSFSLKTFLPLLGEKLMQCQVTAQSTYQIRVLTPTKRHTETSPLDRMHMFFAAEVFASFPCPYPPFNAKECSFN